MNHARITYPARFALAALAICLFAFAVRADTPIYENAPINYSATPPHDPAALIKHDVETGKLKLETNPARGYLDSLLKALDISPSTQALVFSQTSFQRTLINPKNPRALYFNDETYVGFVPGGEVIEVASTDPKLGTVFYTVNQPKSHKSATPEATAAPKFIRQTDNCLQCHGESMVRDIPGLLIRSVFPDSDGQPIFSAGTFVTTHESPFAERWGGWYVTCSAGAPKSMGNVCFAADDGRDPKPLPGERTDLKDVSTQIDIQNYLTRYSDIVPLLVLEHQTEAHNLITHANYSTLLALRDEQVISQALGEKVKPGEHSESTTHRIKGATDPLVEYLLFANEQPFAAPIKSTSPFIAEFQSKGPRDAKGRSLRDFDLQTRLFRYPCSYLIYSPSFDGLPNAARTQIYRRMHEVLIAANPPKPFTHLTKEDRTALLEILPQTKPELREVWKSLDSTP